MCVVRPAGVCGEASERHYGRGGVDLEVYEALSRALRVQQQQQVPDIGYLLK